MEAMFMIPGIASPAAMYQQQSSVPSKKKQLKYDTHDTCSCGASDNNNNNNNAGAKRALQASSSSSSSNRTDPSSTLSHLRTTATTTAILINNNDSQQPSIFAANKSSCFAMMESGVADELVEKTEQRVEHALLKASVMFQSAHSVERVPKFNLEDPTDGGLTRCELLGSGGFASVYALDITDHSRLRNHTPGQQYVVKHLSPKLLSSGGGVQLGANNRRKLHAGAKDIILESHILSALNHPNIISVHGLSQGGVHAYADTQRTDAYFMILPRLQCTLADKITTWKRERLSASQQQQAVTTGTSSQRRGSPMAWWRRRSSSNKKRNDWAKQLQQSLQLEFLCERLEIVKQLCEALEYLHSKRIMHRDVKPPNIGFDADGCLKLFDFGLAKELPPDSPVHTSQEGARAPHGSKTFSQLGNTGTTRYMAPEVIRREPYNCKVDVFAISIVCWELMTLKKPYGLDVSGQFVKECVAIYDDRPTIPSTSKRGIHAINNNKHHTVWPKSLKKLVQQGWTKDIASRLSATQMKQGLQEILNKKQQQYMQSRILMGESLLENNKKHNKCGTNKSSSNISATLTIATTMSC